MANLSHLLHPTARPHLASHADRILECYDRVKAKAKAGNPGAQARLAEYDAVLAVAAQIKEG